MTMIRITKPVGQHIFLSTYLIHTCMSYVYEFRAMESKHKALTICGFYHRSPLSVRATSTQSVCPINIT